MSRPQDPPPALLVTSVFSSQRERLGQVIDALQERFGPLDAISEERLFDKSRYYEREMGWPLYRHFLSFEALVRPETLVDIKLRTYTLEEMHLHGTGRLVNIDPGCLTAERLILATGKNYIHRVYLGRGIYADLTLIYRRGSYRPLPWTYPDYADPEVIDFFNAARGRYLARLRAGRNAKRRPEGEGVPPLGAGTSSQTGGEGPER